MPLTSRSGPRKPPPWAGEARRLHTRPRWPGASPSGLLGSDVAGPPWRFSQFPLKCGSLHRSRAK